MAVVLVVDALRAPLAAEAQPARKAIESLIGLDEHYRVEEQTVERSGG